MFSSKYLVILRKTLRISIENIQVYCRFSVVNLFTLGFAAGLPLPLILGTLALWLREAGIDRGSIGMLSWIALIYACKFMWSPLVDQLPLLGLKKLLGKRRSWLLFTQVGIIIGLLIIAHSDPQHHLTAIIWGTIITAFFSATYDITLDAYRIEVADVKYQAAIAASYIFGYRVAYMLATAGVLVIVTAITIEPDLYNYSAWKTTYIVMACCILIGVATTLSIQEPQNFNPSTSNKYNFLGWFQHSIISPFIDFIKRHKKQAVIILLLISLYRISDIVLGAIANVFYLDIGFTKLDIAQITKIYGLIMNLAGAFIGGIIVAKYTMYSSLLTGAIAATFSNLSFCTLSYIGANTSVLAIIISIDNCSAGIATVAFIAYLSSLVNKEYSATQYAFMSSIMLLVPKFFAGFTGFIVDGVGYNYFFIITSLLGIPAIVIILLLMHKRV